MNAPQGPGKPQGGKRPGGRGTQGVPKERRGRVPEECLGRNRSADDQGEAWQPRVGPVSGQWRDSAKTGPLYL